MKRLFLIAALLPSLAFLGLQVLKDSLRKRGRATASKNEQEQRDALTVLIEEPVPPEDPQVIEAEWVELDGHKPDGDS
jgi:hypothetical protein